MKFRRILSGMRPTGRLHLGHYHGALKNWVALQEQHTCFFFVADWHSLTTDYANPPDISANTRNMLVDWLAAGLDPERSTLFVQSQVPEHAELFLLLAMLMPQSWLERVPTYREQQENLTDRDLTTYGFLGYPLLQTADILLYGAQGVPVGADQVPHIELSREVARRFNSLYGRTPTITQRTEFILAQQSHESRQKLDYWQKQYQEQGNEQALADAEAFIKADVTLNEEDRAMLVGYITGGGMAILTEPHPLLTVTPKVPGLDGRKMSKSYGNTIFLREEADTLKKKLMGMKTDPARARRTDPGNPECCPVWDLHKLYSGSETQAEVIQGCTTAAIGCSDCKGWLLQSLSHEQELFRQRAAPYLAHQEQLDEILKSGSKRAAAVASHTLHAAKKAVGLG